MDRTAEKHHELDRLPIPVIHGCSNRLYLEPQSRETLFPWSPLQIGGTGVLSPLGKAYGRLQPSG